MQGVFTNRLHWAIFSTLNVGLTAPADFATTALSFKQLLAISTVDFATKSMSLWLSLCLWIKFSLEHDDLLHLCKSGLINNRWVVFFNDDFALLTLVRVAVVFIIRESLLKLGRAQVDRIL